MSTLWIPCECPECGAETDAAEDWLAQGLRPRCECGALMQPCEGYGFDEEDEA